MKINKYEKGKIYMIITDNSGDIYVGSTIQTLKARLQKHESYYRTGKYCSSQEILKHGDYKIVLIKNYPCSSKLELEEEEGKFQRDMVCVNKRIASRTPKQWREDNKEAINNKNKEYNIKNCEVISDYQKEYRIKNRETLRIKRKEIFNCPCGGRYSRGDKARHFRSEKHQKYQNSI